MLNAYKYFKQRKIRKQQKWDAEFDKAFKEIMKEERQYAETKNYNAHSI